MKSSRFTRVSSITLIAIVLAGGLLAVDASKRSRNQTAANTATAARKVQARKNRKPRRASNAPVIAQANQPRIAASPTGGGAFSPDDDRIEDFAVRPEGAGLSRSGGAEPADEPGEAMKFYREKRLPEGETDLPVERYFEAKEQMEQMPQYSTELGRFLPSRAELAASPDQQRLGVWTPLGPGNVGGRTRALLVNPRDPNVMYAAGVAGGVWKSTNAGSSWTPLTDLLPNLAVNSLALDPANPNTIYAGTGEGYFNGDAVRGAGIFKTADGGTTWARLAATAGADFFYVNDLVVSNNDGRRVYAATRTGVWRSLNGGETWTRTLNTTLAAGCLDLAARTDQPADYLFASCGSFQQATIFRNPDAGGAGAWAAVLSDPGMGRTTLAIAPSNQSVIYALATSIANTPFIDGLHGVFRSMANGDPGSWTARVRNTDALKINTTLLSNPLILFQTDCRTGLGNGFINQGWYDNVIAVDPLDPNRVWAGGVDLFRSDDGGANWGVASYWWAGPPNEVNPVGAYAHADQHAIIFHPQYNGASNQTMFVGGDGGIFRADNARAAVAAGNTGPCNPANSQVRFASLNHNYGVTQFYHGSVAPDGKSYYGGTQDNGTVRGTDAGGANAWTPINGGDGGYTAFDPANPETLFAAFTGISYRKSTDSGATFSPATFGIADGALFINPYIVDPSDSQRMWTGGSTGIWRTMNGAAQWTRASAPITTGGTTSALAVAPANANAVLAGRSNGAILRANSALTSDTFTAWQVSQPRAGFVSWVAFDPANHNVAYATYSTFGGAHVYRSIDGGATWTSIDGTGATGIPDIPVHCLVVDPNTSRLYVGTDLGVFVSTTGGATWAVENTGFANTVTESLSLNIANGATTLYAFTHGRGAFKVAAGLNGCDYSISPATRRFPREGGEAAVNVTVALQGCDWRAESNAPWISVAPNSGGAANGTVAVRVAANNTLGPRGGTVNIGGRSFSVIQDGFPDDSAPAIAITAPAMSVVNTTAGFINVAGTASDNIRVASVAWRTDRGVAGAAAGTTQWTSGTIPLATGRNLLTFTAADNAGNIRSASLTVNATPATLLTTVAGAGLLGFSGDNGAAVAASISRAIKLAYDGAGNLYFADFNNHRVRRVTPSGVITTVAGNGTAGFSGDGGQATQAQLNFPLGVAIDGAGNLYISEQNNHRVRKVTAATGVITTAAGNGTAGFSGDNGAATAAQLNQPEDVAVDRDGNLYIADFNNHRIRRVAASSGVITTVAGNGVAGFSGDGGPATAAQLAFPNDVAVDGAGDLFICDANNQRIRKVTVSNGQISTVAGSNLAPGFAGDGGPAVAARLATPTAVALDGANNLFIVDRGNFRIRVVTAANGMINTIAGGASGFSPDGAGAIGARLALPTGVAADPLGQVVFSDRDNFRIRRIVQGASGDLVPPQVRITSPTAGPTFTATAGSVNLSGTASDNDRVVALRWSNDRGGSGEAFGIPNWTIPNVPLLAGLNHLTVAAWDSSGNSSSAQLAITYNPDRVIVTVAGTGAIGSSGDGGPGVAAQLWLPRAVAFDAMGNVYAVDTQNHRVRKIAPDGAITAFAGSGALGSSGDGGPAAAAAMNEPRGMVFDRAGNAYIADSQNNRVRRVNAADGRIVTFAGTGEASFGGDDGPARDAHLSFPLGLAFDAAGNLYLADAGNGRIRRVNASDGKIATIAGNGLVGFDGDGGPAKDATLNFPAGVAVDGAGNVYFVDQGNARVRRVNAADGRISTVAGTGVNGFNGDGIPAVNAQINSARLMTIDAAGDLYLADQANHRIRKVTVSTGIITTVAGAGTPGSAGDGGSPTAAQLFFPTDVKVDDQGNLYIADGNNHRIRRTLSPSAFRTVSSALAASFNEAAGLAPEAIAVAFGARLATSRQTAPALPLPQVLAGSTLKVKDALGIERLAPMFFADTGQINFQVPLGAANGVATLTVTAADGTVSTGTANIASVAPGLFSANMDGRGLAAALALRIKPNNQLQYEPVIRLDPATNRFVAVPIDLGVEGDRVFLIAFATGIRGRGALSNVSATVGGMNAPVVFAGATPGLVGLDQSNIQLDRSLAGKGEVDVILTVDGRTANTVRVSIK